MLVSTVELISLAASNSVAVFCFCNLIIAILLVGGSKPKPNIDVSEGDGSFIQKDLEDSGTSVSIDVVGNEEESPPEKEEEEDELRKRVEEFIEKINRGWRAEKLKAVSSSQ